MATGLDFWKLGMSPLLRALVFSSVLNGGLLDWIPALGLRGSCFYLHLVWFEAGANLLMNLRIWSLRS